MKTDLVANALRMAWFRRHPEPDLLFHSDRGRSNCSHEFRITLKCYGSWMPSADEKAGEKAIEVFGRKYCHSDPKSGVKNDIHKIVSC